MERLFAAVVVIGMLCFTVNVGWLRNWAATAEVPQMVITLFNPGRCSCDVRHVVDQCRQIYDSTRMGAVALFTCFLVGFVILTYFATVHRGPNWISSGLRASGLCIDRSVTVLRGPMR